jgi:hypothetical protein
MMAILRNICHNLQFSVATMSILMIFRAMPVFILVFASFLRAGGQRSPDVRLQHALYLADLYNWVDAGRTSPLQSKAFSQRGTGGMPCMQTLARSGRP